MKRDLIKQFFNEWRDNVWLIVEFIVVFLTIWIILAYLIMDTQELGQPIGVSPDNIYEISVKKIDGSSPEYVAGKDSVETYIEDRNQLMRRLKENEFVEKVAIHQNALPFNYNYYGENFLPLDIQDSIYYDGNLRQGSPEIAGILKFEPSGEMSVEEMEEALERGEILVSESPNYKQSGRDVKELLGKRVIAYGDSSKAYKVAGIIKPIRRNDYEALWGGTIISPLFPEREDSWTSKIAVRVKPGMGKKFRESFETDMTLRKVGNVYLTDIKSLESIRSESRRSKDMEVRLLSVCVLFLLLTVLLGVFGTFWFRVQQRVGEIAIRKVCGATRKDVFARLIGEGSLILFCAILLVTIGVWPFYGHGSMPWMERDQMIYAELIAIGICWIGMFISLYVPARKVMEIEPAAAIKDE